MAVRFLPRVGRPILAVLTDREKGQVVRGDEFSMGHVDFEVPFHRQVGMSRLWCKSLPKGTCRIRSYEGCIGTKYLRCQ